MRFIKEDLPDQSLFVHERYIYSNETRCQIPVPEYCI